MFGLKRCETKTGLPPTFPVSASPLFSWEKVCSLPSRRTERPLVLCWALTRRNAKLESVCQTSESRQTESSSVAGADRFCLPAWKQPLVAAEVLLFLPQLAQAAGPTQTLSLPSCNPVLAMSPPVQLSPSTSPRSIKISALVSPCFLSQGFFFHGILPFCAEVCFRAAWRRAASAPTVPAQGEFLIPDNTVAGPRPSPIRAGC